jgi:MFS family permease
MSLLAPDILEEARGLSVALSSGGLFLGLLVWLFGWRGHRFWIVLATTVSAGLLGLTTGPEYGTTPVIAGVLLAVAAGVLALALVRVVAFVAGGVAGFLLMRELLPAWNEPLVSFLVGGLVGLMLFRLWTMVLTSLAGTMLMAYSGLSLADHFGKLNAVAVAEQQAMLVNWVCCALVLMGVVVQFVLDRKLGRKPGRGRGGKSSGQAAKRFEESRKPSWLTGLTRRAG